MPAGVSSWPPRAGDVLRHLRAPERKRYLRLRHDVKQLSRDYLSRLGFLEIDSPSFGPPLEEYGNLHFGIDVPDGRRMWLNHSPQFFKQAMVIAGYDRCFQFAHCFRWEELDPERTDQLRGLVQLDLELTTTSSAEVRALSEGLVLHLCEQLRVPCRRPFPVLDGAECLTEYGTENPYLPTENDELSPVWVTRSPLIDPRHSAKAGERRPLRHVMAKPAVDPRGLGDEELGEVRTESYDLVVRGSEIAGGALRVHDAAMQGYLLELFALPPSDFAILLELLRSARPHGGIAFGLDRLVTQLASAADVTEVNAFPQWII